MKSRAIQTRYWDDEKVVEFSSYAKYLYIYLLTCQYINVSGVFQLSAKKIQFETALTDKQFQEAKEELSIERKVLFYDGWVYVLNAEKNNNYRKIPSNEKTYQQEWERVPNKVKEYFTADSPLNDQSDTGQGLIINHKSEIISHKSETIKQKTKEEIESEKVIEVYNSLFDKRKTVSTSWFDNFIKWRKAYSLEDILEAIVNWHDGGWLWKYKDGEADLTMFFRTSNKAGSCDYIGQLLNRKVSNSKRPLGEDEYINAMGERKKKDV